MKIFLTEEEVIELAYDTLDMNQPDPDKVHNIALKMDMVYDEDLGLYEDVEEVSLRKYIRKNNDLQKSLDEAFQVMLKYQDVIAPKPLTEEEHSFYGHVTGLLSPSLNCNHKWIIDTSSTVAVKRCVYCKAVEGISSDELWSVAPSSEVAKIKTP